MTDFNFSLALQSCHNKQTSKQTQSCLHTKRTEKLSLKEKIIRKTQTGVPRLLKSDQMMRLKVNLSEKDEYY